MKHKLEFQTIKLEGMAIKYREMHLFPVDMSRPESSIACKPKWESFWMHWIQQVLEIEPRRPDSLFTHTSVYQE